MQIKVHYILPIGSKRYEKHATVSDENLPVVQEETGVELQIGDITHPFRVVRSAKIGGEWHQTVRFRREEIYSYPELLEVFIRDLSAPKSGWTKVE